jgi:putative oxidoreductase
VLMAVSIALGLIGPGNYSLDALFGIVQTSALLFGALAVAALLVDVIGLLISRSAAVALSREDVQSSLPGQSASERERQKVRNS